MDTDHPQDDLLIAWGLAVLSTKFEIADPQLSIGPGPSPSRLAARTTT